MKRTKGVTLTSLVISIAILLIIVTFAVNVGFENIQKAKVESFKNDAKIVSEVIEVLRLKIESFPDIQKNSYLNRLTLNSGINANELNNYLKSKSQSYTNLHQDLIAKGINPKYISMNSLKNLGKDSDEKYMIKGEFSNNGFNNDLKHEKYMISMGRANYTQIVPGLVEESYNSGRWTI